MTTTTVITLRSGDKTFTTCEGDEPDAEKILQLMDKLGWTAAMVKLDIFLLHEYEYFQQAWTLPQVSRPCAPIEFSLETET